MESVRLAHEALLNDEDRFDELGRRGAWTKRYPAAPKRHEDPRGNGTAPKIHFLELSQQPIELAQRFASLHTLSFLFC